MCVNVCTYNYVYTRFMNAFACVKENVSNLPASPIYTHHPRPCPIELPLLVSVPTAVNNRQAEISDLYHIVVLEEDVSRESSGVSHKLEFRSHTSVNYSNKHSLRFQTKLFLQ